MRNLLPSSAPWWLPYLIVTAAALAIYANSLGGGFVWDDRQLILRQPEVRSLASVPEFFTSPLFTGGDGAAYYRPVVTTTLAVDHAVGGADRPWVFHLSNLLIYAACCAAVCALFRRLAGEGLASLGGALLFAAHAVHTESVAWISGRSDLLAGLFMALALLAVLRREECGGDEGDAVGGWLPRRWALPAAGLCTLLALLSKEVAFVLPVLCVLLWLRRPTDTRRRLLWPLAAVGAGTVAYLLLRWSALSGVSTGMAVRRVAPWTPSGLATVAQCVLRYTGKLIMPLHLSANFEVQPYVSALTPGALASLAGGAALLALTGLLAWKDREMGLALAWVCVALAPVLHVIPIAEMTAERFLFVPSIGFCLLAAYAVRRARSAGGAAGAGTVAAGALCLLALGHGFRTVERNPDWRGDRSIAVSSVLTAPETARSHLAMGMVYENEGRLSRARQRYVRFLRLAPSSRSGRVRLGNVNLKMGRYREALVQFLRASPAETGDAALMADVANCYIWLARERRSQEAWALAHRWARRAAGAGPGVASAQYALARTLRQRGKYREALRRARQALKINSRPIFRRLVSELERKLTGDSNDQ